MHISHALLTLCFSSRRRNVMKRFTHQLLGTLFVFGCGSGAMASPSHGQWLDPTTPDNDPSTSTPDRTSQPPAMPDQNFAVPQNAQNQAPGCGQPQSGVAQNLNATPDTQTPSQTEDE